MIEVDSREVLNLFANLNTRKQTKALKSALKKGSQILQKETRRLIRSSGFRPSRKRIWKDGSSTTLNKGVWYSIARNAEGSTIHINYKRRKGDPRLNWLEKGTSNRTTRKGWNRGKINNGKYFFKNAKANKEREIFSNMNRLISESIRRIARR